MKKVFAIIFLITITQSFSQEQKTEKPHIEVVGTAIREVIPDKIFIEITLTEKTINKKPYPINLQEERLKNIVKALGIDSGKLTLSDSNSSIIYRRMREKGVALTKEYILEVNTAQQLTDVFTKLNAANIKEVKIGKTEHSNIIEIRRATRIEAIKAAKEKASYLLNAIGEECGKPLEVKEVSENFITNLSYNQSYNTLSPNGISRNYSPSLNFKPIEVKFSYYIKYEIK